MNPAVVRTRMAPSPTGELHIGSLRTLLFSFAYAKKYSGQFIIRIEDTDQKRYVPGAEKRILKDISDCGLSWDEGPDIGGPYGPYTQTERLPIYQKYITELLNHGFAYYCFCTPERLEEMRTTQKALKQIPKYDRHCLNLSPAEIKQKLADHVPYVIRLKVPDNQVISFVDSVRGQIKINTNEIDDQVLIKSDGIPTYHFAVVVDDYLMHITHIFRGEEWISSTPKQVILYNYFGWPLPQFTHLTVLLDPSHSGKMSKRHGSVFVRQFLDDGYLPEALLNFLMLLGWNPGTDQEVFSLAEFIQAFSTEHLHKQQPVFDRKKLDYFNGLYLRQKTDDQLVSLLTPYLPSASTDTLRLLVPLIKERIITLKDAVTLTHFLFHQISLSRDLFVSQKLDLLLSAQMLSEARELLDQQTDWQPSNLQPKLIDLIKSHDWPTGKFFMAFRLAVAGSSITPPIVESLPLLTKPVALARLMHAIDVLRS
ncbi:MAG: glutamate--tRNA ligase [Candidatus Shapirobacteria bacterium]|jgi:glutamyl-tRNA synthetase